MSGDNRTPSVIVLDTSYLLEGRPRLREYVAGRRGEEVKGLIPDTVLAELEWYAKHPETNEKAWLAIQLLRLLKDSLAKGEVEYFAVRPKECPPPPGLDDKKPEDQVLVVAHQVKTLLPERKVLLATGDEKLKARAATFGIEAIK
ncbi:MAG: PIN domain-containing protein [Betaproteobacteria bacterium]